MQATKSRIAKEIRMKGQGSEVTISVLNGEEQSK